MSKNKAAVTTMPSVNQDSYAERRELFKNIWETTSNMKKTKPKVIKTLRLSLDDVKNDKLKQRRLKNLRTVCNKILDFCDQQDIENIFIRKMIPDGCEKPNTKKIKKRRRVSRLKQKTETAPEKTGKGPSNRKTAAPPIVKHKVKSSSENTSKVSEFWQIGTTTEAHAKVIKTTTPNMAIKKSKKSNDSKIRNITQSRKASSAPTAAVPPRTNRNKKDITTVTLKMPNKYAKVNTEYPISIVPLKCEIPPKKNATNHMRSHRFNQNIIQTSPCS